MVSRAAQRKALAEEAKRDGHPGIHIPAHLTDDPANTPGVRNRGVTPATIMDSLQPGSAVEGEPPAQLVGEPSVQSIPLNAKLAAPPDPLSMALSYIDVARQIIVALPISHTAGLAVDKLAEASFWLQMTARRGNG